MKFLHPVKKLGARENVKNKMNLQAEQARPARLKAAGVNLQTITAFKKQYLFPTLEIIPVKPPADHKKGQSNALLAWMKFLICPYDDNQTVK